jgi:hypothetical protein
VYPRAPASIGRLSRYRFRRSRPAGSRPTATAHQCPALTAASEAASLAAAASAAVATYQSSSCSAARMDSVGRAAGRRGAGSSAPAEECVPNRKTEPPRRLHCCWRKSAAGLGRNPQLGGRLRCLLHAGSRSDHGVAHDGFEEEHRTTSHCRNISKALEPFVSIRGIHKTIRCC